MKKWMSVLEPSLQHSLEWLKEIQQELGWTDKQKVYVGTRAVLQVLRDRLTIEEASQLGAGMPLIIKGMFYEGFSPGKKHDRVRTQAEFYSRIQHVVPQLPAEELTAGVLVVLGRRIANGEIDDMLATLPKHLREMMT